MLALRHIVRLPRTKVRHCGARRALQSGANKVPDFAFAFELSGFLLILEPRLTLVSIDGVLVRSSDPLSRAHKALSYLQSQRIPFILLTNGGGRQ
jgi:hypothetical protein